jgi:hypothetical protein
MESYGLFKEFNGILGKFHLIQWILIELSGIP